MDGAWDWQSKLQCNRLERVQTKAGRIVIDLIGSVWLEYLYKEVGWSPLSQQRNKHKINQRSQNWIFNRNIAT